VELGRRLFLLPAAGAAAAAAGRVRLLCCGFLRLAHSHLPICHGGVHRSSRQHLSGGR
jgi:hypothetical protein